MNQQPAREHSSAPRTPLLLALALAALLSDSADAADDADGRALFEAKCAMCHREMGMGTGLLSRRMDPAIAKLELRSDLTPAFVAMAARIGLGNMPRIPRGEVSDRQLQAIGEYLARGPHPAATP